MKQKLSLLFAFTTLTLSFSCQLGHADTTTDLLLSVA